MPAPTSCDERAQPLARRGRPGLGRAPDVVVERRHRERDRDVGAVDAASASTSTSRTISGPRVMIENGFGAASSTSMQARVSR